MQYKKSVISAKKNIFENGKMLPKRQIKKTAPTSEDVLPSSTQIRQSGDNILCPLCHEHYSTSDWIRCESCGAWWHEDCTDYLGTGTFLCDLCKE